MRPAPRTVRSGRQGSGEDRLRPAPDEPLFLPADARRHWYLGYLYHWKDFQSEAIEYWDMEECQDAFDEINDYTIDEPRPTNLPSPEENLGPAKLEDYFRREVLEVVVRTYNTLLTTETMQEACEDGVPEGIWIEKGSENEQLAAKGVKPTFMVRTQSASGEAETRLLGHVEYLGGRPGALTHAIREVASQNWGTLRCVLGKPTSYVLGSDSLTICQATSPAGCSSVIPSTASLSAAMRSCSFALLPSRPP